jgi:hypothetical protein
MLEIDWIGLDWIGLGRSRPLLYADTVGVGVLRITKSAANLLSVDRLGLFFSLLGDGATQVVCKKVCTSLRLARSRCMACPLVFSW